MFTRVQQAACTCARDETVMAGLAGVWVRGTCTYPPYFIVEYMLLCYYQQLIKNVHIIIFQFMVGMQYVIIFKVPIFLHTAYQDINPSQTDQEECKSTDPDKQNTFLEFAKTGLYTFRKNLFANPDLPPGFERRLTLANTPQMKFIVFLLKHNSRGLLVVHNVGWGAVYWERSRPQDKRGRSRHVFNNYY